jgi:conjugal transfer pilus assembly protein TraE
VWLAHKEATLEIGKALNRLLLLAVAALLVTNIATAIAVVSVVRSDTTVLVPPVIGEPLSFSKVSAGSRYLQQMAEYFAFLKLNVSPETVVRQYGQLLDYVDARDFHRIQPLLADEARAIQRDKISSTFFIQEAVVAGKRDVVQLRGVLTKYVGARALAPESVTYQVAMAYQHGLLTVRRMERIDDSV